MLINEEKNTVLFTAEEANLMFSDNSNTNACDYLGEAEITSQSEYSLSIDAFDEMGGFDKLKNLDPKDISLRTSWCDSEKTRQSAESANRKTLLRWSAFLISAALTFVVFPDSKTEKDLKIENESLRRMLYNNEKLVKKTPYFPRKTAPSDTVQWAI